MILKLWKENIETWGINGEKKSNHKDKCHLPHNFDIIWSFLHRGQEEQKQVFDFLESAMILDASKSLSTSKAALILNIYTDLGRFSNYFNLRKWNFSVQGGKKKIEQWE